MPGFLDLQLPSTFRIDDIYAGPFVGPQDRLKIMNEDRFEELTEVWLFGKIGCKYLYVKRFAGPGDKGRDVVGYYEERYPQKIDIYQCKYYHNQLTITDMLKEFAKLCYYTFRNRYPIPKNYFIVSLKGCGPTLRTDYIDKPKEINDKLIGFIQSNPEKIEQVELRKITGFIDYVRRFDFSIVKEVTPLELIDDFSKSKYYPYYFGGGLKNFNPAPPVKPKTIQKEEENYVNKILEVYSENDRHDYLSFNELSSRYIEHFEMQRTFYYTIESFRRAVRDSLPNLDLFDEVEEIIHQGINDIILDPSLNGFNRLSNSLERATLMNLDACTLKNYLKPNDKKGVCHRLANADKVRWVIK